VAGILLFFIFILESYWVAKNPLIPLVVLQDRTAAITYIGIVLMGVIQFALLYYIPLYFEIAKGFSPLVTGAAIVSI
jgi:hypothetical protein